MPGDDHVRRQAGKIKFKDVNIPLFVQGNQYTGTQYIGRVYAAVGKKNQTHHRISSTFELKRCEKFLMTCVLLQELYPHV